MRNLRPTVPASLADELPSPDAYHRRNMRSPRKPRGKCILAVVLAVASLMLTVPAGALQGQQADPPDPEELAAQGLVRLDAIETGTLLFETDEPGWYAPAPTLRTDIDVTVSGPIARTVVSQRFRNAADIFVEGKYVFPLPEGAAVDTLRMKVGDRWIAGQIEERDQARQIYEEAKSEGRVASLIEQQRPNVFTTSIANIAPNVDVVIQIEYQQSLAPRDGVFGVRIPLVVAPRYVPGGQRTPQLKLTNDGWVVDETLNSGDGVTPPIADPRVDDPASARNPVEITIDLDAGYPIGPIESPYHNIAIEPGSDATAQVTLPDPIPADRDFYLSWQPDILDEPFAAAFTEQLDKETHYIAMVTPPSADAIDATRQPREVIFVQDTSGSMDGASLTQAKAGLVMALERLDAADVFNIIEFNSTFSRFSARSVDASPANVRRAVRWVNDLQSTGGTNMVPALRSALNDRTNDDRRLRQVIFLTDGLVSDEQQMLELVEDRLGTSRLFTVGIGSAPNSYFMSAAARAGRGSFVVIGDISEVSEQMQNLFVKIETPAIVDLAIDGFVDGAEISPSPLPDLYAGDPIVLTVRVPKGADPSTLRLTGRNGADDWHLDVELSDAQNRPGVSKLWAREHIRDLEALRVSPEVNDDQRDEIDGDILATALSAGLVSRLTSLVAVDVEVSKPADEPSASTEVATNLPTGWNPEHFVFADSPEADAAPAAETALSGAIVDRLRAAEENRSPAGDSQPRTTLAVTGAHLELQAALGAALVALGAVFVATSTARRTKLGLLAAISEVRRPR